ncbi:helix-turn-helix domain-containing protein [Lacisediminimonas sp.]|uniref:helix-turn-helix domain-containing protein n=1 Tax=Lacisediminimonas sp. TaxID=3060582 RepID=UPI0027229267|nr:helix-turn-helix domain-containing protein [Lacisediminimonas sp.]MDO8299830.1 helix-turn-helix domain-containing protein [Lacisediminimonas sp.]
MDKRKKAASREVTRQLRIQFYDDIEAGHLSLQDAVKLMRQMSGLTQVEFAQNRGVSLRVVKEIERGSGNPTVKTLNQIACLFGLEVAFRRSPGGTGSAPRRAVSAELSTIA